MKKILLVTCLFCLAKVHAQHNLAIQRINAQVTAITQAGLPTQRDTTTQDYPKLGLYMKTYLEIKTFGKELKQYAQVMRSTRTENQVTTRQVTGTAFYYDQGKLIKVEEFAVLDAKEMKMEWYFSDDKCFFHTARPGKANDRAALLLNMAYGFLKKVVQ